MKIATPISDSPRRVPGPRGQTLIFMMMIMIILTFVAFSVYDTQHVIVQRVRTQNSSDAAALMGARWQLSSLNAIGELNLMKITTQIVMEGPSPFGDTRGQPLAWKALYSALDKLQARICILGPIMGVFYAQQAAKLNGMHAVPAYAEQFYDLAQIIEADPSLFGNYWINLFDGNERQQLVMDFAALCREIGDLGVAALPGNAFGDDGDLDWNYATAYARAYLGNRVFYAAIAAQDWCILKPLLWIYSDATTFWGLVETQSRNTDPCRFLSLQLTNVTFSVVASDALNNYMQSTLASRGLDQNPNWPNFNTTNWPQFQDTNGIGYVDLKWVIYKPGWYNQWDETLVAQLLTSPVKRSCNYSSQNADSVWISQASANVTMAVANPDRTSWTTSSRRTELNEALNNLSALRNANSIWNGGIVASAAARPFGQIDENTPPTQYPVVLPVFSTVRLIPLVFSSSGGDFDPAWLMHKYWHIPSYTQQGLAGLKDGCIYCQQLRTWENSAFRQIGISWWNSQTNGNPCVIPTGGQTGIVAH